MLGSRRLRVMLACTIAASAATAVAQAGPPGPSSQDTRYGLSQRNQDSAFDTNSDLRRELDSAGILSRTGPYRLALPLASFGEKGPKLLFTYVPRMKDGVASKVFMFVVRINTD